MNTIALVGTLTDNPSRRDTRRGVVATFRLAATGTSRLWIDIETWGQPAGRVAQHLAKDRSVAATGTLIHDSWTDQAGGRREHWFVRADRITFLDGPSERVAETHAGRADATSRHAVGNDVAIASNTEPATESASGPATVTVQ
jgi:single-stranded DNA-binding protein